jgi:amidase
MGTSADGLPIGVQIVAKPFRDHVALAGAALCEAFTGTWPAPALNDAL